MYRNALVFAFSGIVLAAAGGCQRGRPRWRRRSRRSSRSASPSQREVTDYVDFTGRTDAVQSVDIRPRVTGYLVEMPFKEGAEVKAGDLLFEIDPRPYQAQLDQAAGPGQPLPGPAQAGQDRPTPATSAINARVPDSISQQQLDQDQAVVEEAEARVKAYEKNMEVYKLNLEFTKVISPIDGQVSRYYLTLGNLVNQDQTLLTTVVSLDPMYAYFDMDEPTLLRIRQGDQRGEDQAAPGRREHPGPHGPAGRGRLPAPGDDQLRQQPGQPHHGQHPGARRLREPQAAEGRPAALARDVRADPPADRPAAPGAAGHRPGHRRRTRG